MTSGTSSGDCAIRSWNSSVSAGSSVVQTAATRNRFRMPCAENAGAARHSFARFQIARALPSFSRSSMPK